MAGCADYHNSQLLLHGIALFSADRPSQRSMVRDPISLLATLRDLFTMALGHLG